MKKELIPWKSIVSDCKMMVETLNNFLHCIVLGWWKHLGLERYPTPNLQSQLLRDLKQLPESMVGLNNIFGQIKSKLHTDGENLKCYINQPQKSRNPQ